MEAIRFSKNNEKLFKLIDKLNECNEEVIYHGTKQKPKRLDHIEKNAVEIEKIAKEMQELVKKMRRKKGEKA